MSVYEDIAAGKGTPCAVAKDGTELHRIVRHGIRSGHSYEYVIRSGERVRTWTNTDAVTAGNRPKAPPSGGRWKWSTP